MRLVIARYSVDYAGRLSAHLPLATPGMVPDGTSRLRFRHMTADDLHEMALLLGDPHVMRFYPAPKTRDQAAAWIAWNQNNYAEFGYGLWIIETLAGDFVGDCGLTWQEVNGVKKLEVGYHVAIAVQGRGLATEAAEACRDFARDHTGADELIAIIHPENRASERVAEKLGMQRVTDDHGGEVSRSVLSMKLSRSTSPGSVEP
ncbi:MAG: GNAT family N-acetyltransferase [Lacisediminihabitans sp.]